MYTDKYIIYFSRFQLYSQGEKLFFKSKSLWFFQNKNSRPEMYYFVSVWPEYSLPLS